MNTFTKKTKMLKIKLLTGILFGFFGMLFSQTNSFVGSWKGKLDLGTAKLAIQFHFEENNGKWTGKMDSPDQGAFGISCTSVELINDELKASITSSGIVFAGKLVSSDSISGTFTQFGKPVELNLIRIEGDKIATLNRPQEPKEPFDYVIKEVKIKNKKDKVELAGTLTIPKGKGPFPAVILISGSGPQDRDEQLMGHKPFLIIADYLTKNGIAVLRYDDRGVGKSTGNFSTATTADFATDAEAVFEFLRKQKGIDPKRVGLIGHSEGGMIAPIVASRNKSVSFAVLLAGPGIPIHELMEIQIRKVAESEGETKETIEENVETSRKIYAILRDFDDEKKARESVEMILIQAIEKLPESEQIAQRAQLKPTIDTYFSPWFRYFIAFDPTDYLKQTSCRVLAVNGEKDVQVTATENLFAIQKTLESAGNKEVKIISYPNLNHLFQPAITGAVSEYSEIQTTISEDVLSDLKNFILLKN